MGRPKKTDPKTEVLQVRLTETLMDRIDEERGTASRSDWARGVLSAAVGREKAKIRGAEPTPPLAGHRHRAEIVTPARGNRPAVRRCADPACHEPL